MKKNYITLFCVLFLAACGNTPTPAPVPVPTPVPIPVPTPIPTPVVTTFEIEGVKISVKGVMKPGAKATTAEMRAAVLSAVAQLEPK